MTKFHQEELQSYSDRLKMPDIPTIDKAKHNLFTCKLFQCFTKIIHTENTLHNVEIFARTIIKAIDHLYQEYNLTSFVKLDENGAAGLSCMSPSKHSIIYNFKEDTGKRLSYLYEYIQTQITRLTIGVVEEFIEPQKRSGDVDADYGICRFVPNGIFFPTSINLSQTSKEQSIAMWISLSSSSPDLYDSPIDWQQMFQTYSHMVTLEASEFGYYNGIYAGSIFITKDGYFDKDDEQSDFLKFDIMIHSKLLVDIDSNGQK